MEKVINNRRYNTATAKEIGYADCGPTGDLDWWETLYQKRNGEFFIVGEWTRTAYEKAHEEKFGEEFKVN